MTPPAAHLSPAGRRRRRPTTGPAHAQRVAWGEDWGAVSRREAELRRKRKA